MSPLVPTSGPRPAQPLWNAANRSTLPAEPISRVEPLLLLPPRRPQSRAERRAADRRALREAEASGTAAMGRRAALTVAVVGLGVVLIQDTANRGGAVTTVAASTGAASATAGATQRSASGDLLDSYLNRQRAGHRAGRASTPATVSTVQTPASSASLTSSAVPSAGSAAGSAQSVGDRMYGTPRSGLPWHSGWWVGGTKTSASLAQAEQWRGSKIDFATTYPEYSSWSAMANSEWSIAVWKGYGGRLAYGLPLLPSNRRGQWDDVISGSQDGVFRTIARQLQDNGFGDSVVRVGLEANGDWFPWGANAGDADKFKAAFRRVVQVMRAQSPKLTFWFDTAASAGPLPGTTGRADMLTTLYPGDDVVDGISMDHYDFYSLVAHTDAQFANAMRPPNGVGLQDGVDFARAHHKGFAVPEWGLHGVQGAGDNPFFIRKMFDFFMKNKDVLVYEAYFDEPDAYIANSLKSGQDPQSATVYRTLWGQQ